MRLLIACLRVGRGCLHVLHGLLIIVTRFSALDESQRMLRVQWWSAKFLRLLGIAMHCEGMPRAGAKLLVANHVSWLDILVINAVVPARFVSKSEVRHWPVIGWLVSAAGTLYIERGRPRDAMRVVHQMTAALQAGGTLAIFPEGTTTDGHSLLPFHANLLQPAVITGVPAQPVALRFSQGTQRVSPAVTFIGETTMVQSIGMIVMASGVAAHIHLLDAEPTVGTDRRLIAQRLRLRLAAALGLD